MKIVTAISISMEALKQIIHAYLLLAIAATGLFVLSAPVHAGFIHGYVYTRSVVINDNNNLTWSEFDPASGSYIRDIGEATGVGYDPKLWRTMSGDEYRGYAKQKTALHKAQSDLVLMSRVDYEANDLLLADGSAMTKPGLGRTTAYVSLLPQSRRFINDPASLILAEYPINPNTALADNVFSMLHKFSGDNLGIIKNETSNRIGFKTAFAVDGAGNAVPIDEEENLAGGSDYEAAGPIANALLEEAINATKGVSGQDGKFTMRWHSIPCPMYGYSISNRLTMKLRYQRFNPKAKGYPGWTFDTYPLAEVCIPINYIVPIIGPVALFWENHTFPKTGIHFDIDLTILSGTAQLSSAVGTSTSGNRVFLSSNKVPVGGSTQYLVESPNNDKITVGGYDFDRDGIQDTTLPGHLEPDPLDPTKQLFVVGVPQELQGVWLSSGGHTTPPTDPPDLTRVLDSASYANGSHQGLLAQISAEDLRNTDLYIVRVSDGKLISERIGLNEYEASHLLSNVSDFGEDSSNNQFFYTLQMQGSRGDHRFISGLRDYNYREFEDWQAASGINPELHQRAADQLQPGDLIRIYAINRATGYIGHVNSIMQPGNIENGDLSFHIDPIIMGPPNLRVRAERGYKIQSGVTASGVTASNDTITQVIGFEGASLTSDKAVTISTEWLDHNGHPMPESLAGAGYTGRVAILSSDKTIASSNDGVHQFSIEPGQHLQVLQLPNALTGSEHFYIHVSGEPRSGNPIFAGNPNSTRSREADFSSSGQNPGILEKRPDHYVPFLVPVFDEMASEFQTQAYRTLKDANPGLYNEAPDPVYRWVYRPEMQFTSYDLTVSEINKTRDTNANGATDPGETINIKDDETPLITSDSIIDILYDLSTTNLLPLDYFNAGDSKELVFVIGEQEVIATLGADQRIIFDDLSFLDLLSPDDFLTIRLYANNDMGNTLWQWAFMNLDVDVDSDNNNGLELPDRNDDEEQIENVDGHPGKILVINADDTDADNIPDYADFDAGEGFAPMVVQIPDDVDLATAKLKLIYEQSDPTIINVDDSVDPPKYEPDAGYLRIWTKNGTEVRSVNDVNAGGHFIRTEQQTSLTLFSINTDREIVLYTELVRDKNVWGGLKTRIEIIE